MLKTRPERCKVEEAVDCLAQESSFGFLVSSRYLLFVLGELKKFVVCPCQGLLGELKKFVVCPCQGLLGELKKLLFFLGELKTLFVNFGEQQFFVHLFGSTF